MFCYISSHTYLRCSLCLQSRTAAGTGAPTPAARQRGSRGRSLWRAEPLGVPGTPARQPCQQSHRGPGNLRDGKHSMWYLAAAYRLYFRLGPGTLLSCTLGHFFLKPIYPQRTRNTVTTTHLWSTAFVSCSVPCADKHSVQMCAINISLA